MLKRIGWTAAAVGAAALLRKRVSEQGLDPAGNQRLMEAHESQTEASYLAASTRVLVLGANFGGLATALELDRLTKGRQDLSILVVDRDNSQLFTPLLWLVARDNTQPNQ